MKPQASRQAVLRSRHNTSYEPMIRSICRALLSVVVVSCAARAATINPAWCEPPTTALPAATAAPKTSAKGTDLAEIKIQMAEARLKLVQSDRNLNALVSSLEDFINSRCFSGMLSTLKYEGPPTGPQCIERMNQLLAVNPDNPAAICLRDGIDAPTCIAGYRSQRVIEFYDSNSLLADLPDTSLKVGLSAAETERIKVQKEMLSNVNRQYSQAKTDEEKAKLVKDATGIYEQLMTTACRLSALRLRRLESESKPVQEPPRVAEARRKLQQVPPHMRADYQRQMREQAEDELARYTGDARGKTELVALIEAIENPEVSDPTKAFKDLQRSRIVLPSCFGAIEQAGKFLPTFYGSTCFGQGFQTPQCVQALRVWSKERAKERAAERAKLAQTPGAKVKQPSDDIIGSF